MLIGELLEKIEALAKAHRMLDILKTNRPPGPMSLEDRSEITQLQDAIDILYKEEVR